MALFARRQVQDAIDQCGRFMSAEAIARKVADLNASNRHSLPAEWEIMLSAAVSRLCPVRYEPNLGGPRRADLLMMPCGHGTTGCLVEITTISDENAHKKNPYDRICSEIYRKVKKLGAPAEGWSINVAGTRIGTYRDAEVRLLLGSGKPQDLFDEQFHAFVRGVRANPTTRSVHQWRGKLLSIDLSYDPSGRGLSYGHMSYTVVHSLQHNPLTSALKAKTKQLRQTGYPGPYGVVICDGDCNILTTTLTGSGVSFSLRDILFHFMQSNRHLAFVLILGVETRPPSLLGHNRFHQVMRIKHGVRDGADPVAVETLNRLIAAAASLPAPLASPANATRRYNRGDERESWRFPGGSVSVSQNKITLSSRALLEILAGRRSPEEFFRAFSDDWMLRGNFFDRQRTEGRSITAARVLTGQHDDDQIEFTFGSPDPAVTQYRGPSTSPEDGTQPQSA